MNGEIRDREIRVISETGEMLGVMSPREAMRLAEEADLDLVKISPNAVPPGPRRRRRTAATRRSSRSRKCSFP